MITGKYPSLRLRRNRKYDWIRRLIRENDLSSNDLILPIFLTEGKNKQIKSDTEVILKLYLKFGISFLDKLNGMFAISIYDKRKNFLYLIKDRFGIKPLYYSNTKKK